MTANDTERGELEQCSLEELFGDVQLMLNRARKHQREINSLISGTGADQWWGIEQSESDDGFSYSLVIKCQQLRELKPVAADLCNNVVHALDQLVGALTRANGNDNSERLQFPWKADDAEFEKALAKLSKWISNHAVECIRAARAECALWIPHAHLAKDISNSGKHWELVPSSATVPAVIIHRPGGPPEIFNLPPKAIEEKLYYEFYTGPHPLGNSRVTAAIGLRFTGISEEPVSPDSVFSSAFRYAETVFRTVCDSPQVRELAVNAMA
ncbi:hypothetical protein PMI04_002485 [Sphingobium sp. AP49]|uniref:hypothetical protein n=1 Tax=Sphingobium sp. AP49 TaxID=1144307 RepID=UPI0012F707AD|nr:hypothetical protein [Sphingobium sp. AP49]WHO39486.1 hypothetical protein PMI04_002485 [Sphingobium sp. AP49]